MTRCLLSLLLLSISILPPLVWAKGAEWIPIDTSEGLVKFRSSIGGVEGYSFIDSASNLNAINEAFLKNSKLDIPKTGAKSRVRGLISEQIVGIYMPIELNVFGVEMTIRSLKGLEFDDPELQVMLGGNFLRQFVVQIDYPNQRMRFLSRDTNNIKKASNIPSKRTRAHEKSNLIGGRRLGGGMPMVKVRLNDETNVWLLLDTSGTEGILVDRKIVQRTNWLNDYASPRSHAKGVHDYGDVDVFVLPTVKFGPFDIGNVEVRTPALGNDFDIFKREKSTGTHIATISRVAAGVVGYEVLKHFVVTLDYKTGGVHLATKASP